MAGEGNGKDMDAGASRPLIIALIGIDGAGKTTAARHLVEQFTLRGRPARLLRNPGGRKNLDRLAARFGSSAERLLGSRMLGRLETLIRVLALLRLFLPVEPGAVTVLDRHLYCQLALLRMRGCRPGRLLRWALRHLPRPDAVVYFALPPVRAWERINRRGEDRETLEHLAAFDKAYRSLEDFPSFHLVDAGASLDEIQRQLERIIAAAAGAECGTAVLPARE
jgi:dTMP kinase